MGTRPRTIFLGAVVLAMGCQSREQLIQTKPPPFDLEEPGQVSTAPVEEEDPAVAPVFQGDAVVFAPGAIAWAEPDQRVVFHPLEEAYSTTSQTKYDAVLSGSENKNMPIQIGDTVYHKIKTRRFARSYPSSPQIILARNVGHVYTGFRWPEELQQDSTSTLHMFACPYERQEEALFYEVGELIIECDPSKTLLFVHLPPREPYNTWTECEEARRIETYAPGRGVGCASAEEREPDAYTYTMLYWFGEKPEDGASDHLFHSRTFERREVYTSVNQSPRTRTIEVGR